MTKKLSRRRWFIAAAALLLILLSWWQVLRAREGLVVRQFTQDGVPMQYMVQTGAEEAPGVLIAHGFSGSRQLMLGYGYVLARAGYGVLLWDFGGHGANPHGLNRAGGTLQADVDAAYAVLTAQPEIDSARVAILGHSMGSGAAMQAGIAQPARYAAVVAVSPTGAEVSAARPRNLLLQAGAWEARFAANAVELLAAAGGPSDDFATGRARAFVLIPRVEHITILFSRESHETARRWLDLALGVAGPDDFTDNRLLWYGLHLLGWLVAATAVAPLISRPAQPRNERGRRAWLGLLVAPFAATGLLALINLFFPVSELGGMLIGGALALWFGLLGLIWLLFGFRLPRPSWRGLLLGAGLFALLWVAFGALGQLVWLPWLLIPARLLRWPLLALACLPWLLAAGYAYQGQSAWRQAAWWLAQTVFLALGLLLAVYLIPGLFFVLLILPVLPLVLAIMAVAGRGANDGWVFGVGSALFFGWLLLALFPLTA